MRGDADSRSIGSWFRRKVGDSGIGYRRGCGSRADGQPRTANQQSEMARINAGFDAELVRLKKLWAGATPGSLGPLDTAAAPASNAKH